MKNLSQNELIQIAEMRGQSRDELEHIAKKKKKKLKNIKKCKKKS